MPIKVKALERDLTQKIEAVYTRYTTEQKLKGLQAMGRKAIELIRERTNRGIDRDGKRIRRLSVDYAYAKRQMIRGKWKFPKGSPRNSQFRAKGVPNFGRLSGGLFGSMSWNISNLRLVLSLKGNRNKKIAEYLEKMGRKYWGLAKPSTNQGKKEREELRKAFLEAVK